VAKQDIPTFNPDIPPDLDHAPLVREEAIEWLETHYPGIQSFATADILRIAGEPGRRWLIARLRGHKIGIKVEFSLPETADAITVLYLRARGVKFRDAVDAVVGRNELPRPSEPKYGGVWNRLIVATLERLRRRVPPRLIGSALFALVPDARQQVNCLIIVKKQCKLGSSQTSQKPTSMTHDYVYRSVLERPNPSCMVLSPSQEILFLSKDQLPARSEITSRHFVSMRIHTELDSYELLIGTMDPAVFNADEDAIRFVGRLLDIVFVHFDIFLQAGTWSGLQTPIQPDPHSADDLQLWLITQLLTRIYPGSLCEISEMSTATHTTRVLASSVTKPWEPSPWEPAKSLEMLSGYASITGIPLFVEKVEPPWTNLIEGVEAELRYVRSQTENSKMASSFSALALPITLSSGKPIGSLYMLMPKLERNRQDIEVRILSLFSRIVGETTERQRSAVYSSEFSANVVTRSILKKEAFKKALLELLIRKSSELKERPNSSHDLRLPFLLLATHNPELDQIDMAVSSQLKSWLVKTMDYIEWKSFIKAHWSDELGDLGRDGFIGEVPGVGMMIALGSLVSKDDLDRIRNAFPTTINRTTPTNSPVKFVAWVLDIPAKRIEDATKKNGLPALTSDVEGWAFNVTSLVDDLAQISDLARGEGRWDVALRKIRRSLQKPGARDNPYLPRLAADCALSLGDWPSALKYAQDAVSLSRHELGSGLVRSLCLEGDAHLCLCDPTGAWDCYSEAAKQSPFHPLPRYYRGYALLLMARLLRVYEDENRRGLVLDDDRYKKLDIVLNTLVDNAMNDLTSAADLLDSWGLIPESYQYRNFHLVPTLIGQGTSYMLSRSPGPAASRLQSARRSFPKDDLFLREFLFAKCWEQGLHRLYGDWLLGDHWSELETRIKERN
jgi:hypothetical protein